MLNKKLAKRYAKAIVEIGKEQNQIEQYKNDLRVFSDLLNNFPDLKKSLLSPLYSAEDLKKIILTLTPKISISKTIQNFLCLLVDKRRFQYLEEIIGSYEELTNELFGFLKAKITTAAPLSSEDYGQLRKSLEKITKKKILLSTVVEPQIIGGVIAEVGDRIFDGSIKNQLQKIGETLTQKG